MKGCIFISLLLYFNSAFGELQCSANGTVVYYVNGVLTSYDGNRVDTTLIAKTFSDEKDLDIGGKLNFVGIHNPSFGFVNDTAELFAQAYYLKTGNSDGKAVFSIVQNIPDVAGRVFSQFDSTGITKAIGFFGYSKSINMASMMYYADESFEGALSKASLDTNTYLQENSKIIDSIGEKIVNNRKINKKMIFVAHSQGNTVVESGIKKITSYNPDLSSKLEKIMGVMHVASPVTPISNLPGFGKYKQRNILVEQDKVIWGLSLLPGYPMQTAPVTHNIITSYPDNTGHFLSKTYLSDSVKANPSGSSLRSIFRDNMRALASELEDNCDGPNIVVSSDDGQFDDYETVLSTIGYAGLDRMINLKLSDSNDRAEEKTTQFEVSYEKLNVANYFSLNEGSNVFETVISSPSAGTDLNDNHFINLPFNNVTMVVKIKATDKNGKIAFKEIKIINKNNRAPTITLQSNNCLVDSYGFTGISSEYVYRIDDDSFFGRGLKKANAMFLLYDSTHPLYVSDGKMASNVINLNNPCPNRFKVGSATAFCDSERSAVVVSVTSARGVLAYFQTSENSGSSENYSRNHLPGNSYELVYLYPFPVKENSEPVKVNVSVLDLWSGKSANAGEVTLRACTPE